MRIRRGRRGEGERERRDGSFLSLLSGLCLVSGGQE